MKLLRDAPISVKVAYAPALSLLGLLLVMVLGLWVARDLTGALQSLQGRTMPRLETLTEVQRQIGATYARINQSMVWLGADYPQARIAALDQRVLAELGSIDKMLSDEVKSPVWDAETQTRLLELQKVFAVFRQASTDALDIKSTGLPTATAFIGQMEETFDKMDGVITAINAAQRQAAKDAVEQGVVSAHSSTRLIAGTGVLALLLAVGFSWMCARWIVAPLREAQRVAVAVAAGDLTVHLVPGATSNDETGRVLRSLGDMSGSLHDLVDGIRRTAETISTASSEIAAGNSDLSTRTEAAAGSLQRAATSVQELVASLRQGAADADAARQQAVDAAQFAREGGTVVEAVVDTMARINNQAQRIGDIIGTIDGIAFQTNILALNAAVEAARAGEQGRGFAVVAGEVRTLAHRSAEAAREIRTLISSSVEQIEVGSTKVALAGQAMNRIVNAIEKVASSAEQISMSTAHQATGIARVNETVAEMDRSTQQNAAMVEQASAATESLRNQSQGLVSMLGSFQTRAVAPGSAVV